MRRHRGLSQAATAINCSGADTEFERQFLIGEIHFRLAKPVQNISSYWTRYRLANGIDVDIVFHRH